MGADRPRKVRILEVGPRDGLQNEAARIPTDVKVGFVDRALAAGVQDIALFVAATESFSRANINRSIEESLEDARSVIDGARRSAAQVRAYISVVFGCPYEGPVSPSQVLHVADKLFELGVDEVVLGDTIGVATPADVARLMDVLLKRAHVERWGMHFHDTRG